jgi:hypothetical protein
MRTRRFAVHVRRRDLSLLRAGSKKPQRNVSSCRFSRLKSINEDDAALCVLTDN